MSRIVVERTFESPPSDDDMDEGSEPVGMVLGTEDATPLTFWVGVAPARRKSALVVFAWSPLVLFEVLGKAHNDSLLAVSALATVWLARKHPVSGMLAASMGALLKLSGLAMLLGLAVVLAARG